MLLPTPLSSRPLLTFSVLLDSSPCAPLRVSCVPRRAFATRNIDRRKLATARPLDSWLDPIYSADLGGPEFRFSSMEFSERPPRFDRQKFVRGWPSRPSIYIYIYTLYILNVFIYRGMERRDRKLLPVVAAGMSEILIENLTARANIRERNCRVSGLYDE